MRNPQAPQRTEPADSGQAGAKPPAATVCLCMIVKNEAPTIGRCLRSVLPIVHHWLVVDTGSTDGTQDIVRSLMGSMPGELIERPWRDFAFNRSEALAIARERAAYSFVIDADDELEIDTDFVMPTLGADAYSLEIADVGTHYWRPSLVSNALPWRYAGVLHEFLVCDEAGPSQSLTGVRIRRNHDGARRRDPETYRKDVAVIEAALRTETDAFMRARYTFYLAQSHRDCGDLAPALERYLERAALGFWQEEVFFSLYQAAHLKERSSAADQDVLDTYGRASDAAPARAEALHGASRFCREKGRHEEGYALASRGLEIELPAEGLFVEPWIYHYGLWDELSLHAYWTGRYKESLAACLRVLESERLPADQRQRVAANARFALERLS